MGARSDCRSATPEPWNRGAVKIEARRLPLGSFQSSGSYRGSVASASSRCRRRWDQSHGWVCPRACVHGDDGLLVRRRRRRLVDGFAVSGVAGSSLLGAGVSLGCRTAPGRDHDRASPDALCVPGLTEGLAPSLWCHPRRVDDNHLRAALPLPPADARDQLRLLLIRDQPDRDAIAKQLPPTADVGSCPVSRARRHADLRR